MCRYEISPSLGCGGFTALYKDTRQVACNATTSGYRWPMLPQEQLPGAAPNRASLPANQPVLYG